MKGLPVLSLIILVIAGMLYAVVWWVAIPASAQSLLPYKWRSISLKQKQEDYRLFIGQPMRASSSPGAHNDYWFARRGNFEYNLHIHYNRDSVADAWQLSYKFKNLLFSRQEVLAGGPADGK